MRHELLTLVDGYLAVVLKIPQPLGCYLREHFCGVNAHRRLELANDPFASTDFVRRVINDNLGVVSNAWSTSKSLLFSHNSRPFQPGIAHNWETGILSIRIVYRPVKKVFPWPQT